MSDDELRTGATEEGVGERVVDDPVELTDIAPGGDPGDPAWTDTELEGNGRDATVEDVGVHEVAN